MLFELLVRFIIIAFDGRFFDRSIHSLDLSVRPRMIDFRQAMFDLMLTANAVEQMFESPFIFLAIGELNAVVSENCMNVIRHNPD